MTTTIQKWGNSLAVRLSKHVAESVDFEEGNLVEVTAKNNEVVIRAVPKTEYSLKELLKGVTPRNNHTAVDWGASRGKEMW
jgi:antitoxin MazE